MVRLDLSPWSHKVGMGWWIIKLKHEWVQMQNANAEPGLLLAGHGGLLRSKQEIVPQTYPENVCLL